MEERGGKHIDIHTGMVVVVGGVKEEEGSETE